MKLEKLLKDLSYGELKNLSMASAVPGTIQEEDLPSVVMAIEDAMLRLHARFILRTKNVLIRMYGHITYYHFLKKYAESQYPESGEDFPYIIDLGNEVFEEDVIKVLGAYTSAGVELPLNDGDQLFSIFTPETNMVQIPSPAAGMAISINYQARHVPVTGDLEQELTIPDVLVLALRSFVAYKIFSSIGTQEATGKAQEHLMNYESQCQEAVDRDLVNTSISVTKNLFYKRGWV